MNHLYAVKKLMVNGHVVKLEMLHSSKYKLLAQEVGT